MDPLFFRSIRFNPADGAGAPPMPPANPPAVSAPAPAPTPAPAGSLQAQIDAAVQAALAKERADKTAVEQERDALKAEKGSNEARLARLEASSIKDKIDAALSKTTAGFSYASATDAAHALMVFQAQHKVELKDGAVLATGADGKPQHLANAYASWAKGDGARYLAAPAAPGAAPAGTPAAPNTPTQKKIGEMSNEDLDAYCRTSPRLKVTRDAHAPTVQVRHSSNKGLEARRAELTALMGRGGSNGTNGTK